MTMYLLRFNFKTYLSVHYYVQLKKLNFYDTKQLFIIFCMYYNINLGMVHWYHLYNSFFKCTITDYKYNFITTIVFIIIGSMYRLGYLNQFFVDI